MKGIRKKHKSAKRPKRMGITIWTLAKFIQLLDMEDPTHRTLFAALVIAMFGLLRASEYVRKFPYGCTLLRRHVQLVKSMRVEAQRVIIHLVRSKTDTFDEGVDVVLAYNGSEAFCPFGWAQRVLDEAPDQSPDAPFFQMPDGQAFTYDYLQQCIKTLAVGAGLHDGSFSTHSLRIGGATTLVALGYPRETVQLLGRWASDAFILYLRIGFGVHRNVSRDMAAAAEDVNGHAFCGLSSEEYAKIDSSTLSGCAPRRQPGSKAKVPRSSRSTPAVATDEEKIGSAPPPVAAPRGLSETFPNADPSDRRPASSRVTRRPKWKESDGAWK